MKRNFLFLLFCFGWEAHARTWTDDQSRKVEAEFIRRDGEKVILLLPSGKEWSFPIVKLSQADRDFLKEQEKAELTVSSSRLNFDASWPDRVTFDGDPEVTIITEDREKKTFIYESANYRYTCDVRLARSVVKGFAVLFEATNKYCAELPLAMVSGRPKAGKHQIKLFEKQEDYFKDGGAPGSAGVFISSRGCVLIPLESLGVKPVGKGYMLDRDRTNKTVPHELTHQLTPEDYYDDHTNGWFTEGIAEYVGVSPYRSGSFNVRNNRRAFVEYVTAYGKKGDGGRGLGEEIHMPLLKDFLKLPYEYFMDNGQINYGCSLLLVSYFCHMDGEGDGARLKAYLKALRAGKSGDEALAALLDGRSYETLEKEISKAWGRYGVDLSFGPGN